MKKRILIIDDNYSYAELAQIVLESLGYAVETAFNARSGLAAANARKPDLILLDIVMPDLDGFETIRRLKSEPATRDIPIILCSVSRGRCVLAEKSAREAVDFLHKTLQREVLQARISRVLDR